HLPVLEIFALPGGPVMRDLQAVAVWVDLDLDAAAVLGRYDEGRGAAVEVALRDDRRRLGRLELEGLAVGVSQRVGQGVERELPGERHGHYDFGTGDEIHRRGLTVIAHGEVPIV